MTNNKLVFLGTIVTAESLASVNIFTGYISVINGKIARRGTKDEYEELGKVGTFSEYNITNLGKNQFLMPGLVDCHTHAPQFPNLGLGLDRPLLEWLETYTFPLEKKYENVAFASSTYEQVVQRLIRNGTTTACYFASLSLKGTLELVKAVAKYKQRAVVGKVSMNIENSAGYYNSTEKELVESEEFIKMVLALNHELVQPVVTPRFAISCDEELMNGLASLSEKYQCLIQSHISENLNEIEYVLQMYPGSATYADVYDKCKLLTKKTIMAHAVHPPPAERALLAARGASVAHCPASNTRLGSGLCPVRTLLRDGLVVGLGTDVSGGDSASILDAARRAMDVSMHLQLGGGGEGGEALRWQEALYLATQGGAEALKMGDKIGSLDIGKRFDALVVDAYAAGGPIDLYDYRSDLEPSLHAEELLQRFLHQGDDRNIVQVYVDGVVVKDIMKVEN